MESQVLEGGQKTHSKAVHTVAHGKNKTMDEMKFESIIPLQSPPSPSAMSEMATTTS
jgi:hypothetical protein